MSRYALRPNQPDGIEEEAVPAVQDALSAENAAIWACGLATAYASERRVSDAVFAARGHHRASRDAAKRALCDSGHTPHPPPPSYRSPSPVTDQHSAIALLIVVEGDVQNGWRAVLDRTADVELRHLALDALTSSAVRATRWRITIDEPPYTRAFPGAPE